MPKIPLQLNKEITDKYSVDNNTFLQVAKANPKDKIEVEIGDSKQADFLPQVKIQRWDNEVNFSARLIHDEKTPTVTTEGDKILWKGDKVEAHFYDFADSSEHPEGASEFEVVLKKKPKTNVVHFSLVDKDVDYFYQPPLTDEKLEDGQTATETDIFDKDGNSVFHRPDNVVGSYAVYAKTPKTNWTGGKEYKCGKVGHIYRPLVTDANGSTTWATLNIQNGVMNITVPQSFLDKGVYPVVVDPTFGNTTTGGAQHAMYSGSIFTNGDVYAGAAGTGVSMSMYAVYSTATSNVQMAIYDTASPANYIANSKTNSVLINSTARWWTANFISTPTFTASNYSLAYESQTTGCFGFYDTSGFNDKYASATFGTFPSTVTWTSPYWGTIKWSIYATYTAAGGTTDRKSTRLNSSHRCIS